MYKGKRGGPKKRSGKGDKGETWEIEKEGVRENWIRGVERIQQVHK